MLDLATAPATFFASLPYLSCSLTCPLAGSRLYVANGSVVLFRTLEARLNHMCSRREYWSSGVVLTVTCDGPALRHSEVASVVRFACFQ